jgi:hypothetical protein
MFNLIKSVLNSGFTIARAFLESKQQSDPWKVDIQQLSAQDCLPKDFSSHTTFEHRYRNAP